MSVAVNAVQDADGKITGYLGIAHDITKRKDSETKLLLLTERLSLATSVAARGRMGMGRGEQCNDLGRHDG